MRFTPSALVALVGLASTLSSDAFAPTGWVGRKNSPRCFVGARHEFPHQNEPDGLPTSLPADSPKCDTPLQELVGTSLSADTIRYGSRGNEISDAAPKHVVPGSLQADSSTLPPESPNRMAPPSSAMAGTLPPDVPTFDRNMQQTAPPRRHQMPASLQPDPNAPLAPEAQNRFQAAASPTQGMPSGLSADSPKCDDSYNGQYVPPPSKHRFPGALQSDPNGPLPPEAQNRIKATGSPTAGMPNALSPDYPDEVKMPSLMPDAVMFHEKVVDTPAGPSYQMPSALTPDYPDAKELGARANQIDAIKKVQMPMSPLPDGPQSHKPSVPMVPVSTDLSVSLPPNEVNFNENVVDASRNGLPATLSPDYTDPPTYGVPGFGDTHGPNHQSGAQEDKELSAALDFFMEKMAGNEAFAKLSLEERIAAAATAVVGVQEERAAAQQEPMDPPTPSVANVGVQSAPTTTESVEDTSMPSPPSGLQTSPPISDEPTNPENDSIEASGAPSGLQPPADPASDQDELPDPVA